LDWSVPWVLRGRSALPVLRAMSVRWVRRVRQALRVFLVLRG
jgi:hypothetical protein